MQRGRRPPLLVSLYVVGVFATGLFTWVGLLNWGWPGFDAAGIGVAVAVLALWLTLWAGRVTAERLRRRHLSPRQDEADQ